MVFGDQLGATEMNKFEKNHGIGGMESVDPWGLVMVFFSVSYNVWGLPMVTPIHQMGQTFRVLGALP